MSHQTHLQASILCGVHRQAERLSRSHVDGEFDILLILSHLHVIIMMEKRIVLFLVRIDIRNKGRIQSIIFDEVTFKDHRNLLSKFMNIESDDLPVYEPSKLIMTIYNRIRPHEIYCSLNRCIDRHMPSCRIPIHARIGSRTGREKKSNQQNTKQEFLHMILYHPTVTIMSKIVFVNKEEGRLKTFEEKSYHQCGGLDDRSNRIERFQGQSPRRGNP